MALADAWNNIKSHLEADAESVRARIEQDLPEVAKFVQDSADSPVTAALAAAVHLPGVPEGLQMVATFIANLDAAFGVVKAQAAAEAAQPAEPAAA